jgi:alkanesulfonate monooxygenase SsuD/methylene tetrahydromethanopterin reductase-like flavin-dependent oxidoreductase (luciferase family)
VKIGAQYQGDERGPKIFARAAEDAGFDSVFCGDHVGHYVDGIATLGCFAGATERITIGVNLLVVPYRPAAVVAKALATIAHVAPGRVIAGFGVGGEFPGEYQAVGADLRTRGAFTDEALDVVTRLWTGEPVSYAGRWHRFEAFQLEPPPSPAPEIWIGGRSEAAMRRAVRFGAGYVPYLVSPEQLARRRAQLVNLASSMRAASETNGALGSFTLACLVTFIPAPSVDDAVEVGLRSLRLSGLTPESVRSQFLLGDDESVLSRLQAYVDAGADHLIVGCIPGDGRYVDEFFGACRRLLPSIRELRPGH